MILARILNVMRLLKIACVIGLVAASSGCFTRTIYVPDGAPVRLRQDIPNAKVWVSDREGKPVPGKMTLKEGWYCLSDPKD
jgi:hypothetical protein